MKTALPIFLLLICSNCFSQYNDQKTYTAEDGLPSTYVFGAYVRSNGELIIGTSNGFSRFNGLTFSNYGYESGLSNLMVHAGYEDSQKNIWIGTDAGMQLFERGRCVTLPTSDGSVPGYVSNFFEYNNRLWVYTQNGIYYLKDSVWTRTRFKELYQTCSQVLKYKGGILFFLKENVYLLQNDRLSKFTDFPEIDYDVVALSDSGFYILSKNTDIFLAEKGKKLRTIYHNSDERVSNFFIHENFLWILFESKPLIKMDLKTKAAETFTNITNPQSLSAYKDAIWISGLHGLTKISLHPNFKFFDAEGYKNVRLIIPDASADFSFLHSPNNLFNTYEETNIHKRDLAGSEADLKNLLLDKGVSADSGQYWAISRSADLYNIDLPKKKLTHFLDTAAVVYDVAYDKNTKRIYASTREKIYAFNNAYKIIDSLAVHRAFVLKSTNTHGLLYYSNQALLIYNNKKPYKCLTIEAPVFRKWDIRISESPKGLISVNIKGDGVRVYEWKNNSLRQKFFISGHNGLRSSSVFMTVFDADEKLWILSDFGISIADPLKVFSDGSVPLQNVGSFGLDIANWEQTTLALSHDKKILIGTPKGIITLNPSVYNVSDPPAPVFIDYLQIQGNSADDQPQVNTIFFPPKVPIILKPAQRSFKIKFQSVSFSNPTEFQYSYRLIKGNDSAWSTPSTSASVSFFRLAAGDYQFQVRSRKANTEWSQPTVFNFSIAPSFWETTLFKVIALLNVVFLIWFGFQSRLRKVRRSAFVQTKLADLEMKALRAQMNPHFIYNALNSIQSLIASGKQKDAMRYVSKFGKLLRLILEHSEEGKTSLQKELDVNSLYIQLEQLRLGFDFAVHINVAEDIIPEEEKVPALIIQPIIENALWHGLTNIKEDKHLTIDVSATDVYLIIGISDNGLGIVATTTQNLTSSEKRKSFGSQIVRKRLMTYNNDSNEPLYIRDLKEIGKQGTEVKLFIRRYVY